jgi:RNA polymerase sigma factor for flagellar operon FliA
MSAPQSLSLYAASGAASPAPRSQDVREWLPLVRRVAHQMAGRLPANVQIEDLMQNGMVGLLDALSRYQEGQGATFETYAALRIRGAILDGLREMDWVPRSVRHGMRKVEAAMQRLAQENGRLPDENEIAAAVGLPLADYQKLLSDARGHQLVYLEDFSADDSGEGFLDRNLGSFEDDPAKLFEDADLKRALSAAIAALPEREKLAMALYYEEELNLREIAAVLGVSESRVCQLHSQAIGRIRSRLFGPAAAALIERNKPRETRGRKKKTTEGESP